MFSKGYKDATGHCSPSILKAVLLITSGHMNSLICSELIFLLLWQDAYLIELKFCLPEIFSLPTTFHTLTDILESKIQSSLIRTYVLQSHEDSFFPLNMYFSLFSSRQHSLSVSVNSCTRKALYFPTF